MTIGDQSSSMMNQLIGNALGTAGSPGRITDWTSSIDWRTLQGMPGLQMARTATSNNLVETRLDWSDLNKFSLYTPILRVVGDTARKCGAEARFVQTENFLDDCAEVMIELRRAGDSTLLDFSTLVQMIEDQGTLAADFSGVRRIVEVTCALLPNPQSRLKEDADRVLMEAARVQQQMAMAQQQQSAQQQQHLARALGLLQGRGVAGIPHPNSPAKELQSWGVDRIKAYLGLKP